MKNALTILAFAATPTLLVVLAIFSAPAPAAPLTPPSSYEPPTPVVEAPAPAPAPTAAPVPDDPYLDRQAEYVLDVMEGWTHAPRQVPVADYAAVARDVAEAVALEPGDPGHCATRTGSDGRKRCLWGVPKWNSDHAKGVLLAAVAYWEGARFAQSVDDGSCNDEGWRAANPEIVHLTGNCDHGRAHSLWQIWPRVGSSSESPINESCNAEAIAVRLGAARCALQILRMSMMANDDLTGYTGEDTWGDKTKADLRLRFAEKALKKHPFVSLTPPPPVP